MQSKFCKGYVHVKIDVLEGAQISKQVEGIHRQEFQKRRLRSGEKQVD